MGWIAITHVMIHKEEIHLAVLAFGGTINLFYTCFNEGLSQALITTGAYLIGIKQQLLWKLAKSASIFLIIAAAILAIPFLIFPETIITLFFKGKIISDTSIQVLKLVCYWLWFLFLAHGFNMIGMGLLTSYGDTLFQMIYGMISVWIFFFLPVYFLIGLNHSPPDRLWLIMAIGCLAAALVYFLRLGQEKWKTKAFLSFPREQNEKNVSIL